MCESSLIQRRLRCDTNGEDEPTDRLVELAASWARLVFILEFLDKATCGADPDLLVAVIDKPELPSRNTIVHVRSGFDLVSFKRNTSARARGEVGARAGG